MYRICRCIWIKKKRHKPAAGRHSSALRPFSDPIPVRRGRLRFAGRSGRAPLPLFLSSFAVAISKSTSSFFRFSAVLRLFHRFGIDFPFSSNLFSFKSFSRSASIRAVDFCIFNHFDFTSSQRMLMFSLCGVPFFGHKKHVFSVILTYFALNFKDSASHASVIFILCIQY